MNKNLKCKSQRESSPEYPNLNLLPKLEQTNYSKWNKTSQKFNTRNKSPSLNHYIKNKTDEEYIYLQKSDIELNKDKKN